MNEPERRFSTTTPPAVKGKTIAGVAARFNSRSENLGTPERPVFEVIEPGAFDDVLHDDVIACFNHEEKSILARSTQGAGTLKLWVDDTGLNYSFESPETSVGRDTLESIKRGDINSSSFAFTIAPGGDRYERQADGSVLRTINKIGRLYDVSPVTRPAYQAATVTARALSGESPASFPALSNWIRLFEILRQY